MKRVRIVVDSDPLNPRAEFDNAGHMICWHNRYDLGDDHDYDCGEFMRELAFEACEGLEDKVYDLENDVYDRLYNRAVDNGRDDPHGYASRLVNDKVNKYVDSIVRDGFIILPLFLMDHSGISMSTGSFGCPWDSGQVGYIVCNNETIQREWNGDRELAEKYLQTQVEAYDDYLTGNIYGFIVEERDGDDGDEDADWNEIDSCWGFFGYDPRTNGMAEHLGDEELVCMACNAEVEYSF